MSLASIGLSAFALGLLGLGYVFAFRVETALAVQRRYAEALSSMPPSEHPDYYEDTREHRTWVFRLGGAVLLGVGAVLLSMVVYGTLFVASFP
ncbi:hypothetical protein DU500_05850 [Haloplanus rubicundus]|uniref:Uncharacterized protein n=1 Tax=Haloplanus rubicundus TaxID=1547898 RepID=A0A345E1D2_9EURY|nr:hypothetical protein [Haloplanus rubicundus]AXG06004.1 hypothetical protein DU500_05850 [Haloplanus rubicundus]AXG09357.1 hypothetical protein DU484_05440 [Haloplanus rubicundus]